jgi:AcrR family transcriptional regulator
MLTHESKEALVEEFRQRSILSAALGVMARRGVAGATMQEIAVQAGISKGTIYLYYANREELFEKVVDHAFGELLEQVRGVLAQPGPFAERLRALLLTLFAFFDEHQEFLRVLIATRDDGGDPREGRREKRCRRHEHYDRYIELLTGFLSEAMESGELRRLDPAQLALFLSEGTSAVLKRRLAASGTPAASEVAWIADLFLAGAASRRQA